MNNEKATSSGGIGFTGLLTILFIALKLTHVIAWTWWLVLMPSLIVGGFIVAVLAVMFVVFLITK